MFIVLLVVGIMVLLAAVIGIAAFSQSSRHDWLYAPATDAQDRWSRRLAGVYVRDDRAARDADYGDREAERGGVDQLIG
jgi:hypothetical protein